MWEKIWEFLVTAFSAGWKIAAIVAGVILLAAVLYQLRRPIGNALGFVFSKISAILVLAAVIVTAVYRAEIWEFASQVTGRIAVYWSITWTFVSVVLAIAAFATAITLASTSRKEVEPLPKLSRIPVFCWILAVIGGVMASLPALQTAPDSVRLAVIALAIGLIGMNVFRIPPYHAGIVAVGDRPVRSVGSGWALSFRFMESVVEVTEIREASISDVKLQVELGSGDAGSEKEPLNLEMTLEYKPNAVNYIRYRAFNPEKLEKVLTDQLRGFATDAFKAVPNSKEAYQRLEDIEIQILNKFREEIQDHYGILTRLVTIDDAAPDPKATEAKVKRDNDAAEIRNLEGLAKDLAKSTSRSKDPMSVKQALEIIQTQQGKIQKTVDKKETVDTKKISFSLDPSPELVEAIKEVLPIKHVIDLAMGGHGEQSGSKESGTAYDKPRPGLDSGKKKDKDDE